MQLNICMIGFMHIYIYICKTEYMYNQSYCLLDNHCFPHPQKCTVQFELLTGRIQQMEQTLNRLYNTNSELQPTSSQSFFMMLTQKPQCRHTNIKATQHEPLHFSEGKTSQTYLSQGRSGQRAFTLSFASTIFPLQLPALSYRCQFKIKVCLF